MIPYDDLKKLSKKELDKELGQTVADRLKLRLAVAMRQSTETNKLKEMRKYIARIRTLKNAFKNDQLTENPTSPVTK